MRTHPRIADVVRRGIALAILAAIPFAIGCQLAHPLKFTVGGTVSGLAGSGLVLQNNGGDNLAVSANGTFTFATQEVFQSAFVITILTQPTKPAQTCIATGPPQGLVTGTITQVVITCTQVPLIVSDLGNNRVLIYNPPFSTNQAANFVLGQADFTHGASATTASTMHSPFGTTVDPTGNLYVADDLNCRVLQFVPTVTGTGIATFSNGQAATIAIGQPNLTTGVCTNATTANTLGSSAGSDQVVSTTVDGSGNLWVSDSGNNRILEFKPPFSSGMTAALVLGQADFTHGAANRGGAVGQNTLSDPDCPVFDSAGNLWVGDWLNQRFLEFSPPFSNGMNATLVLGQANFTSNTANRGGAIAANTIFGPNSPAFDLSGNLWVVDTNNNRVLEFVPPFATGMAASLVVGQAVLTTGTAGTTAATLSSPHAVSFDSTGKLYLSDSGNNRVLVFAPAFATGMSATSVFGQAILTTGTAATTATGESFPVGTFAPNAF